MDLVFTRMPGESYSRRLGFFLLSYVFRALINSSDCRFCACSLGLCFRFCASSLGLFQILRELSRPVSDSARVL